MGVLAHLARRALSRNETKLLHEGKSRREFKPSTYIYKAPIIKLFPSTFKTLWDSSVFKISFSLNRLLEDNQLSFLPEEVFRNLGNLKSL